MFQFDKKTCTRLDGRGLFIVFDRSHMNYGKRIGLIAFAYAQFLNIHALATLEIISLSPSMHQEYRLLNKKALEQNEPYVFAMAPEDLPASMSVWKKMIKDATPQQGEQQNHWILVARYDDKLVGFIEAEREWTKESYLKHLVSITKMFADKDYQQEKIGKELIRGMINLLAKDETITALDLRVPTDQKQAINLYSAFGFEPVNPHKYAVQVDGKFHPHYLMKTTMKTAFDKVEQIEKAEAKKQANQPQKIKIVPLTINDRYPYRNINIRILEQNEPHIFAVAPKDDKRLFIDHWEERLKMANPEKGTQQNLWILVAKNDDGELIGLIEAERESPGHTYKKHLVCITRVVVDNNYRGRGVGKQLMNSMITLLHQDKTITALELWVAAYGKKDNEKNPAMHVYKSYGFQDVDSHDYAVLVGEKFYSHTLMATTMEVAKKKAGMISVGESSE